MAKKRLPVLEQISLYEPIPVVKDKSPSEMSQYELTCSWGATQKDIYFTYLLKNYQKKIEKSANQYYKYLPNAVGALGIDLEDIYSDLLLKFRHAVLYSYLGILKGANTEDTFSLAGAVTHYFRSYYSNLVKKCGTKGRKKTNHMQSLFQLASIEDSDSNEIRYVAPKVAGNFMYLDEKASNFVETLSIPERVAFNHLRQGKITDTRPIRTRILRQKFQTFQKDWEEREKAMKAREIPKLVPGLDTCPISSKNKTSAQFFSAVIQHCYPLSVNLKNTPFARSRVSLDCLGSALKLLLVDPKTSHKYSPTALSKSLNISRTSAVRMRAKITILIDKLFPNLERV